MPLQGADSRPHCTACGTLASTELPVIFAGDCFCIAQFAPVCGTDGKTYPNDCELNCVGSANLKVAYQGECGSAVTPSPDTALPSGQPTSLMPRALSAHCLTELQLCSTQAGLLQ